MNAQDRPGQSSDNSSTDAAQARMEQRRRALRREAKRVIRGVVRLGEDVALKGASEALRVAQRLNGEVRRRIDFED